MRVRESCVFHWIEEEQWCYIKGEFEERFFEHLSSPMIENNMMKTFWSEIWSGALNLWVVGVLLSWCIFGSGCAFGLLGVNWTYVDKYFILVVLRVMMVRKIKMSRLIGSEGMLQT